MVYWNRCLHVLVVIHSLMEGDYVEVELFGGNTVTSKRRGKVLVGTGMMTGALSTIFLVLNFELNLFLFLRLDEQWNHYCGIKSTCILAS